MTILLSRWPNEKMRGGLSMKPSTVRATAKSEINSRNISPKNWKDTLSVKWKQFSRQRTGGWGTEFNKSLLRLQRQRVTGVGKSFHEEKTQQNGVMPIKTEGQKACRTTGVPTLTGARGPLETVGNVTSALPLPWPGTNYKKTILFLAPITG